MKKKIKNKINLLLCAFFIISGCGAKSAALTKEIYILAGCENGEVLSDLNHSINSLNEFFNKNKIKVIKGKRTNECGYILKFNKNRKKIDYVMTDYDLSVICKDFYGLKE